MTPADDPTWPVCAEQCQTNWCSHVRNYLIKGKDAGSIQTGTRVCVPVFPSENIWAEVSIDAEEIAPGICRMALVKSELFTQDEELIPLGLWTKGEGRSAISSALQDLIRSQEETTCKNRGHGFSEERALSTFNQPQQRVNLWTLFMHDMCSPCFLKASRNAGIMSGSVNIDSGPNNSTAMQAVRNRVRN